MVRNLKPELLPVPPIRVCRNSAGPLRRSRIATATAIRNGDEHDQRRARPPPVEHALDDLARPAGPDGPRSSNGSPAAARTLVRGPATSSSAGRQAQVGAGLLQFPGQLPQPDAVSLRAGEHRHRVRVRFADRDDHIVEPAEHRHAGDLVRPNGLRPGMRRSRQGRDSGSRRSSLTRCDTVCGWPTATARCMQLPSPAAGAAACAGIPGRPGRQPRRTASRGARSRGTPGPWSDRTGRNRRGEPSPALITRRNSSAPAPMNLARRRLRAPGRPARSPAGHGQTCTPSARGLVVVAPRSAISPAASATAASRATALRRYRPTQPPASAMPRTAATPIWARGLTANRSRTYVPSHFRPWAAGDPHADT